MQRLGGHRLQGSRLTGWLVALVLPLVLAGCIERAPVPIDRPQPRAATPIVAPAPAAAAPVPLPGNGLVEVQRGDTVFALSRRYGIPVRAVIDANNLQPPYALLLGQKLRVPVARYHTVVAGDTLYSISRRYGIDTFALVQANQLRAPFAVATGQQLLIPTPGNSTVAAVNPLANILPARPVDPARPGISVEPLPPGQPAEKLGAPPPVATAPAEPPADLPARPEPRAAPPPAALANVPVPAPRSARTFAWPVRGNIISGYGAKPGGLHNDGINIAARLGEPVRAAENGIVVYAGNELRGFGNLLLIRHADGWITAYGHNSELLVKKGAKVDRGQIVARAGQTGGVGSPQVHFEVRHGTQAVDPSEYLPTASLEGPRSRRYAAAD